MRTASVFTSTCHRCGCELSSETPVIKCLCGIIVSLEWPATLQITTAELEGK